MATSPQVLLIMDRPSAVIQQGQPSAQMAAWLLDIPAGSDANATAAAFASEHGFPIGTVARVIDLSQATLQIRTFTLTSQWVAS
jgi:hypothetical protein